MPKNDAMVTRIINLRTEENLTQSELAKAIGVGNTVMSKIEKGIRGVSADELSKLANVLNVSTDYLLGRKTPDNKNIDLGQAIDNHEFMTYNGKKIDSADLDIIKRILDR
jgi:transcriptional regulator with XRE-family HTH domain